MALTRKFLAALGIDAEKVDEIINAHTETVDGLKEQINSFKADAEKLPAVQKELDELKKASEEKDGKDPWKVKYEALKEDFDAFKGEVSAKETKAAKTAAYRSLLKEAGIADKRIDTVLKVSDVDKIELDRDGKIKEADKLAASIKEEWADFITSSETSGAKTSTPPEGSGAKLSRAEIYKKDDKGRYLMDSTARQKALAELQASENE